jgi:hypothetical protein
MSPLYERAIVPVYPSAVVTGTVLVKRGVFARLLEARICAIRPLAGLTRLLVQPVHLNESEVRLGILFSRLSELDVRLGVVSLQMRETLTQTGELEIWNR